MTRDHYVLWYRLDGADRYMIWYTGEVDGVLVTANGKVPSFTETACLRSFATGLGIHIMDEQPILHDLDLTIRWLRDKSVASVDCDNLLAVWNLFDDVSKSTQGCFDPDRKRTDRIYDKLFIGNNLLPIAPGHHFHPPTWRAAEINMLRMILDEGMQLFRSVIAPQ